MPDANTALELLGRDKLPEIPPVCVLFGDEPWLKRECLERITSAVLGTDEAELSRSVFNGEEVELRTVLDELATLSMFGERRLVVVEEADEFVSEHRAQLEEYCERPRASAVLLLQVDSWPANTRLYKKLAAAGLQVNCSLPKAKWAGDSADESVVANWIDVRARAKYGVRLAEEATELLLEIVGPQLGRLDQELAKLALLAEGGGKAGTGKQAAPIVGRELVEQAVGGWRAKTAWSMIEAALEGNAAEALVQLDRLLLSGEEPIALLAMMGGSLRRLAAATRAVEQAEARRRRISLSEALVEAGVPSKKFILDKSERQLRQVGRERGGRLYQWLLEADLALKGPRSSGTQARLVLEELIVRLSRQMTPLAQTPVA